MPRAGGHAVRTTASGGSDFMETKRVALLQADLRGKGPLPEGEPERSGPAWKSARDLYAPVHTNYVPPQPPPADPEVPKNGLYGGACGASLCDHAVFGVTGCWESESWMRWVAGTECEPLLGRKSSWRRSRDLVYRADEDRADEDEEGTMRDMDDCVYKCLRPVSSNVVPPLKRARGAAPLSSGGASVSVCFFLTGLLRMLARRSCGC